MKVPKEMRTYCPFCKAHVAHKVKVASKGKPRSLAMGNVKHERKLKGHGGKRAGKKAVKKQGKRQKLILECNNCHKKHEKVLQGRTKAKAEVK
ncbi:MAG: hypothetical protein QW035_01445 [Candidatus Anstonellales archaeon]